MKHALPFLLLLLYFEVSAQHYSCIGPETKTYFTNNLGYLRGMRIDSMRSDNGNTLFYPFHTARVNQCTWGPIADTLGGSWWGRVIVQTASGGTWIQNKWGDTVTIENNAQLNDSWIFYQDTTAVYYEAQIVAWDTMTFLGITDSVKRIRLTARSGASVIPSNPLNDLEMVISKQNGWIQTIDFYLFPYHVPGDTMWNRSFDCYFYEANGRESIINNNTTLIFRRIQYAPPLSDDIHNFQVGDVFWSYNRIMFSEMDDSYSEPKTKVVEKTVTDSSLNYRMDRWYKGASNHYNYYDAFDVSFQRNVLYVDTAKMPEEWFNGHYYYYLPEDSSYCYRSPVYKIFTDAIFGNGYVFGNGVEPSFPGKFFKNHLGSIRSWTGGSVINTSQSDNGLIAALKNGNACDNRNEILSAISRSGPDMLRLQVYPNPTDNHLFVELSNAPLSYKFGLELYNSLGMLLLQRKDIAGQVKLQLSDFPEGLYFIKVYAGESSGRSKFTIRR